MGLDNCKKNTPQRCSTNEDLPTSKVQKDSQTSLLEGIKSSYGTLSTGNALYYDIKKLNSLYSKTEVLFEKASKNFYHIDKEKNRDIYNISRYSLSLIDLIKLQDAHVKSCQRELSTQKKKYELLQKQVNDLINRVNYDDVNKVNAESMNEVKQETAIKDKDRTPHPDNSIVKEDGKVTMPSQITSIGSPKSSALSVFLSKVAKASCKGRKPKSPILLKRTSEEGWTKVVASYGRSVVIKKDSLLADKMEVIDDNRYTSLMPDWIRNINNSEESSDDSNDKSYPLAYLGDPKRQQRSKRLDKSNYPLRLSEDVKKEKEPKHSIKDNIHLDANMCNLDVITKEGLQGPMIVDHKATDILIESVESFVETIKEEQFSKLHNLQETKKNVVLNKREKSKRFTNKNYPKVGKPKDVLKVPSKTTKGSVVSHKQKKNLLRRLREDSAHKKVEIKNFIAPKMKDNRDKKPVKKNTGEKWTDKLSREELLKIMLEGKKPAENKYRLVTMEGLPSGEGHKNLAVWAKILGVKESDIPYIKDVSGKTILLVRYEAVLRVADSLCRIAEGVRCLSEPNALRQFLSYNKDKIVADLAVIKKSWKSFVPLQKSIKVIVRCLNNLETSMLKKFALDDEAIKDILEANGP